MRSTIAAGKTAAPGSDGFIDEARLRAKAYVPVSPKAVPKTVSTLPATSQSGMRVCMPSSRKTHNGAVSPATTWPLNEKPRPAARLRANSRWM